MAARRVLRLAERQARWLRPLPRPPQRIGQWREAQGLSPSTSGPGPLRDLPDWSFSGEEAPPPSPNQEPRWTDMQIYANEKRNKSALSQQTPTGSYWFILGVTGLYWEGTGGGSDSINVVNMQIYANEMQNKICCCRWGLGVTGLYWELLVYTGSYWFILGGDWGWI
ncbi:large ribosomal subunit protein mL52 isoform X1 [Lonchura striata]